MPFDPVTVAELVFQRNKRKEKSFIFKNTYSRNFCVHERPET